MQSDSHTNTVNLGQLQVDLPRMQRLAPSSCILRLALGAVVCKDTRNSQFLTKLKECSISNIKILICSYAICNNNNDNYKQSNDSEHGLKH